MAPKRRVAEDNAEEARVEGERGLRRADLSLAISIFAFLASGATAWTAQESLRFNKQTQADAQKATIFAQFQQQYLSINSQFPPQLTQADYRPPRDSGEYDRLEAYWLFCFSEWYATQRVNHDLFGDLWSDYYAPLIADGLDIPSLRYVLEDMLNTRPLDRGEWGAFFAEIARIAREDGKPLSPQTEQRVRRFNQAN
jgi:type II secretory pathway pseudopilin PulG